MAQLMSLIRETLTYNVSDEHWDLIVEVRSEVQRKKLIVNVSCSKTYYYHQT